MDKRLDEILNKLENLQKRIDNIENKVGLESKTPSEPLKPAAPPIVETSSKTKPSEQPATPTASPDTPKSKTADYKYTKPTTKETQSTGTTNQTSSSEGSTANLADAIKKATQASINKLSPQEIHKPQPESKTLQSEPSSITVKAKAAPTNPDQPKRNLEQIIGQKWMLFVGIAVMLIGGLWFFKYAYEQGWVSPVRRCIIGTIAAMALLVIGEVAFRKRYRLHAAGLFASGIVWLYYTAWAASPNGRYAAFEILSSNQAFAAMIAVTAIGAFLALRANMISNAIITVIGAMATPLLLSSGQNHQVPLMTYIAAINIAFLSIAWIKRWYGVGLLALAGTILITFGWADKYFNHPDTSGNWFVAYIWVYWAMFTAFFTTYRSGNSWNCIIATGYTILTWLAVFLHAEDYASLNPLPVLVQTFILTAATLVIARLKQWNTTRSVILIWSQMLWLFFGNSEFIELDTGHFVRNHNMLYSAAWAFGVLFLGDVFWSVLRQKQNLQNRTIEIFNSIVTIVSLYAAIFLLYNTICYTGLDITTAAMGIIALLAAAVIYKRSWAPLGDIYLVAGIALLGIAVPLMFDLQYCTIAWIALGAAAFTASRLFRRPMLIIAPAAMVLVSWLHFLAYMLEYVPSINDTIVVFNNCQLKASLFTAWGISAAFLACATAMLWPKADKYMNIEFHLSWWCVLIAAATALKFALVQMKPLDTTDFALLIAAGIAGLGLCRPRLAYFKPVALTITLLAAAKFIAYDMLYRNGFYCGYYGTDNCIGHWLILNQQCITAVTLAGILIWITILTHRQYGQKASNALLLGLGQIIALVTITLAGNYEVTRYTGDPAVKISAVMIWWACFANVLALYCYKLRGNKTRWNVGAAYCVALLFLAGAYWTYSANEGHFRDYKFGWMFVFNPKFTACLITSIGLLWTGIKFEHAFSYKFEAKRIFHLLPISGLFLLTLGGNCEAAKLATENNTAAMMVTLWWAFFANVLILAGMNTRAPGYRLLPAAVYGPLLLIAAALRWTFVEVISKHGIICEADTGLLIVNAQFITCLLIAAGLVWMNIQFKRNALRLFEDKPRLGHLAPIAAMILIALGGSHEATRILTGETEQMALSLWWGIWATTMLVTGFALRQPICRYFAITLYAITLVKVFLVDMRDFETIYRVLTFIGLGLLLIGCSWLYHRFLRDTVKELTKEPENE